MGENTAISWTNHTFNPVKGCDKVSPGCKHCYAERDTKRYGLKVWGPKAPRIRTTEDNWKKPRRWNKRALAAGVRERVFCASWADVGEDHPDWIEPRRDLAQLIEETPGLDWLLLTKRPQNLVRLFGDAGWSGAWPVNVWVGTTVEDQKHANERIPHLLKVPARVRFLSCEPLLEAVSLRSIPANLPTLNPERDPYGSDYFCALTGREYDPQPDEHGDELYPRLSWVIVGGESGPDARKFHLTWARDLQRQCGDAGVAFFCKQFGARPVTDLPEWEAWPGHPGPSGRVQFDGDGFGNYGVRGLVDRAGADPAEWPADLRVQEFPA